MSAAREAGNLASPTDVPTCPTPRRRRRSKASSPPRSRRCAPDGSIDLERVDALVGHYARDGADGLFVCGTTGESVSLSTDERMRLADRFCAAARDVGRGMPVAINATHTSLPDCKTLAAHAAKVGAAGVAVMAPFYFKPRGVEEVVASPGRAAGGDDTSGAKLHAGVRRPALADGSLEGDGDGGTITMSDWMIFRGTPRLARRVGATSAAHASLA